jgi:pyruvate/2-oxoacid:ferredoxin oxidoreductase alpha subunit/ferredoxin
MASGRIAQLWRLWRRAGDLAVAAPGTPALLPVESAVAALELQICDGIAHGADVPASAAAAQRIAAGEAPVRNAFGRPIAEELAAAAPDRVAVATGMALAGLRASAFLTGEELIAAHAALVGCAERRAPLVLHAVCGGAGHAGCAAVADSGCFQLLAGSGQEALDWTLLARWVAERALVPGLVVSDVAGVASLALPDAEAIATYLGRPDDPITAPTEAQRLLFGAERARVLAWFDPERPVATGGLRGDAEQQRARAAAHGYFWEPVAGLVQRGMDELSRLTGRSLAWVQPYRLDDAEIALVARGTGLEVARFVAEHLRRRRGWKVGVLGIPWLRPFPAAEVARALSGRRAVAVIDALGAPVPGGAPLFREVAAASDTRGPWISAVCSGAGPDPTAIAGLCELLRGASPPARVDMERIAIPATTGFPRRDALLQSLANAHPALRTATLPRVEGLDADLQGARSAGIRGAAVALPADALARLADTLASACDAGVCGSEAQPAPGAWEGRVRAIETDLPDPGPRAPVSLLLVTAGTEGPVADPLAALTRGGVALLATDESPARVACELPKLWRRTARERELRLFAVPAEFDAGLAVLGAFLRGDERAALEAGDAHELHWRELPEPEFADRELPEIVRRIPHVRPAHDSLPRFWGEIVQPRQGGAYDGVADPLTASGVVPAAASALQPAPEAVPLPVLDPSACTGCGRCWTACPDAAIGAVALGTESLFTASSRSAGTEGAAAEALRRAHRHLADRISRSVSKRDAGHGPLDTETCRAAWSWLRGRLDPDAAEGPAYDAAFGATLAEIERLEPVVSEPLFGAPEREQRGDGSLLVLAFDPRACLGCGLCVAACRDTALQLEERTPERAAQAAARWRAWEALPDTTGETLARAAAHPDVGPLAATLLSRHCGQAQIGGGEAEPGSGERLAGRLVVALVEQVSQRRSAELAKELADAREQLDQHVRRGLGEGLSTADLGTLQQALAGAARGRGELSDLAARLDALGSRPSFDRGALLRATRLASELEQRHQLLVEGADGLGRARFGVVAARGAAARWTARYPGHPYYAPLTLAPTSEGVELARGVARGLVAQHLDTLRDLRRAALEIEAPPDLVPRLEAVDALGWDDVSVAERASCPPLLLLGDDRALLAEGFEALTRLLASNLPIKVVLLDGRGRLALEPEPTLVAMAQRHAFVLATSPAHPGHFAGGLANALTWAGPAVVHVCAPSPARHGFPPDATLERARLAVEARAHVLLRYDPRGEGVFGLRASLDGNPNPGEAWGELDFATWAAGELRFAEHFAPVAEADGVPLAEWLDLPEGERGGRVPVVEWDGGRLAVDERLARAAGERRAVWGALQELTGVSSPFTAKLRAALAEELDAERRVELEALRVDYEARLAAARDGTESEALTRLTERLLALSGFESEPAPKGNGT